MRCAVGFKPAAATWSRHGHIQPMPCRAQPSTICGSVHCSRTVAVLSERSAESGGDAMDTEQRTHTRAREVGIIDEPRRIGKAQHFGEMRDRARALLSADHREVRLMTVQPREK